MRDTDRGPSYDERMAAGKRAARVTDGKLLVKRARNFRYGHGSPGDAKALIRDMRLALEGLLDEVSA
jgi:hypothetical protein